MDQDQRRAARDCLTQIKAMRDRGWEVSTSNHNVIGALMALGDALDYVDQLERRDDAQANTIRTYMDIEENLLKVLKAAFDLKDDDSDLEDAVSECALQHVELQLKIDESVTAHQLALVMRNRDVVTEERDAARLYADTLRAERDALAAQLTETYASRNKFANEREQAIENRDAALARAQREVERATELQEIVDGYRSGRFATEIIHGCATCERLRKAVDGARTVALGLAAMTEYAIKQADAQHEGHARRSCENLAHPDACAGTGRNCTL